MAPDGGSGTDLDHPNALAVPAWYRDPHPARVLVGQDIRKVRQPCALGARTPDYLWSTRRRRFVQRRVEPQARDADKIMPSQCRQEVQGSKAAVTQQHDLAPGHPATRLKRHLPRPVGQLLVPPAALAAVAL